MNKSVNLLPNICKIQYVTLDNVASIETGSTSLKRIVNFITGQTWLDWYFTPGSYEFEELYNNNVPPYWSQKITCFFPGKDISQLSDLQDMTEKKLLLRILLTNGDIYLMGVYDNPVLFQEMLQLKSGGTNVTFVCNSVDKLFILE